MQHHWRLARQAALCIILFASRGMSAEGEHAAETIVLLADGRALAGRLDASTDAQTLWVRQSEGSVELRSGFDWDRVAYVLRDGQPLDKQAVLRATEQLGSLPPEETPATWEPLAGSPPQPLDGQRDIGFLPVLPAPASLQIGQAGLANWNRDAAIDGLQVSLRLVDDFGRCVPASGQLEITLTGTRQDALGGVHIRRRRPLFVELGRWSVPVRGPVPSEDEIWLRLPFTRIDPLDPTIADRAFLHVRLNVPGSGSFEAARVVILH